MVDKNKRDAIIHEFNQHGRQALYHFSDDRNTPLIVEHGGLYSTDLLEAMAIVVPAYGGDENSRNSDKANGMDEYVHLCFLAQSPMCYRARQEGRIGNVTFHSIDLEVLREDGVKFVPGFSNTTGVPVYDIEDAWDRRLLDFEALYTWIDWRLRPDVHARRIVAEKHELLIPHHIPIEKILNLRNHG